MSRITWTTGEVAKLKAMYPLSGMTRAQIGSELRGRSGAAIGRMALRLGITSHRPIDFGPKFDAMVSRRNKAGYSDSDIAAEWGCRRQTVSKRRKALGLPGNQFDRRHIAKLRQRTRRQCRENSVWSLAEMRWDLDRVRVATQTGWPAGTLASEAMVLDQLESGPKTHQMIRATGISSRRIPHLIRRGLIVSLGRKHGQVVGQANQEYVYALAPGVARRQRGAA